MPCELVAGGRSQGEVRPFRWYSVVLGRKILVLLLDSQTHPSSLEANNAFGLKSSSPIPAHKWNSVLVVLHYPPVRDPIFPRTKDEQEIERYLSKHTHSLQARFVVVGSHIHNYERFLRDDVTYFQGRGKAGSRAADVWRAFQASHCRELHYLRFRLEGGELQGTMVRFDPAQMANLPGASRSLRKQSPGQPLASEALENTV